MNAERSQLAKKAAHISWINTEDRSARTANARMALEQKFERMADPDGVLSENERAKRVEHVRKMYYADLTAKSLRSRRLRTESEDD